VTEGDIILDYVWRNEGTGWHDYGSAWQVDFFPIMGKKFFYQLKFANDYIRMAIKASKRLTMISVNATELKNKMGRYLQHSITEPVIIEKTHRPFSVILSYDEYERLRSLEDAYWIEKANQAKKEGFVGVEESMKFIEEAAGVKA